ncbi:serine/threonine-protein kinase [Spirulina sp. CS-785/01]|uniref:serine/threonine protein kinase n=1 Tax=Spirulina sp. CS-785/01 TaxID=3021716 RepID=UPI002330BADE|nr:serine/threonine-protein kinase [Spirulina sp. CS-785/01]MDB9313130.1 serine/threonine-protein kinase [Spirulina sp. CS-785/01]
MTAQHDIGDKICDRFLIKGILGQGGVGVTYAALDEQTQENVALKALSLRRLDDWKALELFEREAKTLKQLDHPQIPQYIDYVQVDTESDRGFYLAQQLVEGTSLADLVAEGWRSSEDDIKDIAQQVLNILTYLHTLHPPVIHRDIKPQNLIRKADDTILLVDFGAVQDTYRQTQIGGSTIVGTYGYMPPEQYHGRAYPATDLYGLGATLLYILSGSSPADFPQPRLKIDFRSRVNLSPHLTDWLERMLEPALEDRFSNAKEALTALTTPLVKQDKNALSKPAGSRIDLKRHRDSLDITIPPVGLSGNSVGFLGFALFWNGFLVVWTLGAAAGGGWFALFSIPFWCVGIFLMRTALYSSLMRTILTINRQEFTLTKYLLGFNVQQKQGKTAELVNVEKQESYKVNNRPIMELRLHHGVHSYAFANGITTVEQNWLKQEINQFLESL